MHSSLCALALCAPQGGGIVSSGQSGIMRPSVRVVVQIISRIRSGKQPEYCHVLDNCLRLPISHGAEFATSVYQRECGSCELVARDDPGCELAARGRTVRRPS